MSPVLTNVMMIPIDHEICNRLAKRGFVYSRYADDLLISAYNDFNWRDIVSEVQTILDTFRAPFRLNEGKTRYGSRNGRNWNLGLMLNQDNNITVGHKNKKRFKAMVHSFMADTQNGVRWDIDDVQTLQGQISYYRMIEPDYITHLLQGYSDKFKRPVEDVIKSYLAV